MKINKKILALSVIGVILTPIALIGCSKNNTKETTEIASTNETVSTVYPLSKNSDKVSFKLSSGVSREELKSNTGKEVEFYGYVSIDHLNTEDSGVADNGIRIATLLPEGLCPFHMDMSMELDVAIPVKLKDVDSLKHTYLPVKISGVLKDGEFIDGDRHKFDLIVDDATIEPLKVEETTGILTGYTKLAETGIFEIIRKEQVSIDEALGYKIFGKTMDTLNKVDIEGLKDALEIVSKHENAEFEELEKMLDLAITVGERINDILLTDDMTLFEDHELIINTQNMFMLYQTWQLKYAI